MDPWLELQGHKAPFPKGLLQSPLGTGPPGILKPPGGLKATLTQAELTASTAVSPKTPEWEKNLP